MGVKDSRWRASRRRVRRKWGDRVKVRRVGRHGRGKESRGEGGFVRAHARRASRGVSTRRDFFSGNGRNRGRPTWRRVTPVRVSASGLGLPNRRTGAGAGNVGRRYRRRAMRGVFTAPFRTRSWVKRKATVRGSRRRGNCGGCTRRRGPLSGGRVARSMPSCFQGGVRGKAR